MSAKMHPAQLTRMLRTRNDSSTEPNIGAPEWAPVSKEWKRKNILHPLADGAVACEQHGGGLTAFFRALVHPMILRGRGGIRVRGRCAGATMRCQCPVSARLILSCALLKR